MSILARFRRTTSDVTVRTAPTMVEMLEERTFLSASPAAAVADMPLKTQSAVFANKIAKNGVTQMIPITITGFEVVNGVLNAVGKLGNQAFKLPINLGTTDNPADPNCPILNLELGEIHLDVLGLNVDTSEICLDITAQRGPGNLLGNLLCSVAGLLDGGLNITQILSGVGGLTPTQRTELLTGLTNLLNQVFGKLTAPSAVVGASQTPAAAAAPGDVCDILNLEVGPVDLTLLGLNVHLDDCNNGPVTVDITAEAGPGNLLGNLLCGVTRLLDNPSNPNALANLLGRISRILNGLLR